MKRDTVKKIIAGVFTMTLFTQNTLALDNEVAVWPGKAPGSESLTLTETITDRTSTCTIDRAISLVTTPTITPFIPSTPNGTSIIICPGGAYARIVYDVEGVDIANMFNEVGVTAFILKYRLPGDGHANREYVTLQDAQRAIRYVKKNAATWGLDTSKVGIMGCSAGGHAAASLATDFNKSVYTPIDATDSISAQPFFSVFLYPVISMETAITHAGTSSALLGTTTPSQTVIDEFSTEKHVTAATPPAFIAYAANDSSVSPQNSIRYAAALDSVGVPVSLNVYTDGGHGKGICKAVGYDFANWVSDCKTWLDTMGLLSSTGVVKVSAKKVKDITFKAASGLRGESIVIESDLPSQNAWVQITNIAGAVVHKCALTGRHMTVNTAALPSGVYFVSRYSNNVAATKRVVLKK